MSPDQKRKRAEAERARYHRDVVVSRRRRVMAQAALVARRRARGLCVQCGRPARGGARCRRHARDHAAKQAARRQTLRVAQAANYAKALESRADSVERRPVILSSDSDAVSQYRSKLATLERERDQQKAVNAAWRKFERSKDPTPLYALGFSDDGIARMTAQVAAAYSWEKAPFAKWSITNLGARIRDIQQKIERLERDKATPEASQQGSNGVTLEDCPADNRVRLFFPGKPDEATRSTLKRNGFRWTPSLGCWQAYRSALHIAQTFVTA